MPTNAAVRRPGKAFDVAVIGAGVSGASVAHRLAAYDLKTVLIEKHVDVAFGVSKANSGIIHAGFHHGPDSLKARLEIRGNLMFEQLHHDLDFPFRRIGILVAAFSYEEMKVVDRLYAQGLANGVPQIEICNRDRIRSLEPQLNTDVVGGLYAPTGGVIEPYRFVFSLAESAVKNGVVLRTGFEVVAAEPRRGRYVIRSRAGDALTATHVVNAAGLHADDVSRIFGAEEFEIKPRKGEEFLLDRNAAGCPDHVIFPVPAQHSKGMLVIPTAAGTMMVGPTAVMTDDKDDRATTQANLDRAFSQAAHLVPAISRRDIITAFAGLRPTMEGNDFYIERSARAPHFIQVAGIQSPGLTASPAIAEYVKDLLKKDGLGLTEKPEYDPRLPKSERINEHTPESAAVLMARDPRYGNIVCRCEAVSEAEVVEAIRKGHTTLDAIKFYTRSGMGRCQGGFCTYKILKVLTRETGMPVEEITKRGPGSHVVVGRISPDRIQETHEAHT